MSNRYIVTSATPDEDFDAAGGGLPTAAAAGEMPVAEGAGTTYAARARILSGTLAARDALVPTYRGDRWFVTSGTGSGTLWEYVNSAWSFVPVGPNADDILTAIGGIKTPSSANVGDVLTYDGSVWGAEAPGSATTTYTLGGAAHDYTADAQYAPAGLTAITGGSVSGRLGDGTAGAVPHFTALYKGSIAALARNASGIRLTHAAANSQSSPYPYFAGGAALLFQLPTGLGRDAQFDFRVVVNFGAAGYAVGGTDTVSAQLLLVRDAGTDRPYVLAGYDLISHFPVRAGVVYEYYYVLASQATFGTSPGTQFDVSSSGEGTVAGITTRDVRIILNGGTLEILTGLAGGALTRRAFYSDMQAFAWRGDLSVILSLGQSRSTPVAGYYAQADIFTVTPL